MQYISSEGLHLRGSTYERSNPTGVRMSMNRDGYLLW